MAGSLAVWSVPLRQFPTLGVPVDDLTGALGVLSSVVMVLAGVFVGGVRQQAQSGEHGSHSPPYKAVPTDLRAPRG